MTPNTDRFQVALVQEAPVFLNVEATLDRVEALAEECAAAGARVIVFPETWLPGYPVWIDSAPGAALWGDAAAKRLYRLLVDNSVSLGGDRLQRLQAIADRHGVVVVIGAHESHGATLYNTTFTFDGAGGMKLHRKLTPTYTERLLWGTGDGSTLDVTESELGTIGGLICWEHWLPLARAAMHSRHELLHTAQWPWVREIHEICSRQYAFEGQCFVAASGCVMSRSQVLDGFDSLGQPDAEVRGLLESIPGDDDELLMRGRSRLIGPDGSIIAAAEEGDPRTVYGEVDPALAVEGRMLLDTDGHYSRPDVFTLHVDTRPKLNVEMGAKPPGEDPS